MLNITQMADLKGFRKANNLTQQAIAEYLGVKKPFICQIETGRNLLPRKHLDKLLSNTEGWDISLLSDKQTELSSNNETDTPVDVVVVSQQVLDEMTAQRQLTEQALALAQEQLEAKQETIEAVREQLATTQEQLSAEQQQTNNALASLAKSIERIDKAQAQMDELILMLKKEQARQDHHLAQLEAEHKQSQQSQKPTQPQLSKSKTDN